MALSTQRALPSLLSPESARHDVYVSFRGIDSRRGFVSQLYDALQHRSAIKTFMDHDLQVGAPIYQAIMSAIEQSHLAIVVLSPNYASSSWCLDELAKIVESMETRKNEIMPVFLDVDRDDVRHQRRSIAEAFAMHEERFSHDIDKVERWRAALTKVANLPGWESKNYKCQSGLIEVIVSSLAEAFVTHEELFRHDIDKVERWAVANISGCDSRNYDGTEKGITEVLEKILRVDVWEREYEKKLETFQEQDHHIYICCLAKLLFRVDLDNGIRELAGLLLKNEIKKVYDANGVVEQHLRKWIEHKLLAIICSPRDSVPRSTFQVISELARNMLKCWPQLTILIERSLHDEQLLTPAVLETFGHISEKIGPNGEDTVRKIFKVLVRGMNLKSNDSVCLAATKAMYYTLSFVEINFFDDMEVILKAILETVGSSNPNIEQAAYECLIVLPSRFYCNSGLSSCLSPTYLVNIMEITTKAVSGRNSIQAIQFWISICEAEIDILKINSRGSYLGRYLIRDNLKDLISLLLPLFHRGEIELLYEKASEFDRSLCLCVGYIAQAVGEHVECFTKAVELFIDDNRTTRYNYVEKVIACIVDFFVSDIFGEEVSEVNKTEDLTEGGKKGKAANEMERGEGSQKPEKPDKKKGLGQWEGLLLRQMLRIVGGLLKQDCEFLHEIFTETVTRYSAKMRDACGHYIKSDVFSFLRDTQGDDLLRKFVDSWHSTLCMIKFLSVFFSDHGCHSGELMMFQMNELQTFGLSWILLLIFPEITNAMTELIDLATKEDKQIDRKLFLSVEQIYVHHGLKGSNKNEASAQCAESIVKFCEKLLERDDDEIREQLEIVGVVSKYFIDIDHFAQFYFKTLGSRIHSVDWEQEKRRLTMVRKMLFGGKQEDSSSLDNLEASVNDTALDAQKFKEFFVNNPVNLSIVGPHWPFEDVSFENIILPEEWAKELAKTAEVVREFLKQPSRPGASRKFLKMIHPLSSCTTECIFGTETIELVMSIVQATLLRHFEIADTWTFSDLLPKLGITHEELVSLVHSLSQENSKLLIKEPNTESILSTDRFELNTNFTFTSPIPLPVLEDKRRKNVLERVDNDMSNTIFCMLMKIMKQHKDSGPMDREKLADAAIVRCAGSKNCGFVPTNEAVDNCIESLIKSKDLLVDENDPNKLWWN